MIRLIFLKMQSNTLKVLMIKKYIRYFIDNVKVNFHSFLYVIRLNGNHRVMTVKLYLHDKSTNKQELKSMECFCECGYNQFISDGLRRGLFNGK